MNYFFFLLFLWTGALEIFHIIFLLKITLTVSSIWNLKLDNSTDLLLPFHHTAILTGIFCVITFQIKAWFVSLCIKFSSFIFFKKWSLGNMIFHRSWSFFIIYCIKYCINYFNHLEEWTKSCDSKLAKAVSVLVIIKTGKHHPMPLKLRILFLHVMSLNVFEGRISSIFNMATVYHTCRLKWMCFFEIKWLY